MTQKTIIITGASRGLGAAIARLAADENTAVILNARSADDLKQVAADIEDQGGTALVVPGDVSKQADCQNLIQQTIEQYGRLDALINNAGLLTPINTLANTDPDQWQYNLAVNIFGPMMLIQAAIPHLRETNGRIINISSGAATSPMAGWSAYCASKAALNHLTRVLALEEPAITSLAVRPGVVDTKMQAEIREDGRAGMTPTAHQRFLNYHADNELLPPEKPARAILALARQAPNEWSGEFLSWDDLKIKGIMNGGK